MRIERLDMLRGLALLGICVVNVWELAYGYQDSHLALLPRIESASDQITMFLVAFLFEGKFYPIFAFLFGAGFALMGQGCAHFPAVYRRRLCWLLAVGLLHGFFIFAGDILTAYALYGFVLLGTWKQRPAQVWRFARRLLWFWLAFTLAGMWAFGGSDGSEASEALRASADAWAIAKQASWSDALGFRVSSFASTLPGLLFGLPEFVFLFLLGSLAVRQGWFRHWARWRRPLVWGVVVGVPLNLLYAWLAVRYLRDPGSFPAWARVLRPAAPMVHPILSMAYISAVMLLPDALAQRCSLWLAPAGRMALTNYLSQSLLGLLLLSSPFLAGGARFGRPELLLYCGVLFAAQVMFSRWWLHRYRLGPFEAMWRRFTYGNARIEG